MSARAAHTVVDGTICKYYEPGQTAPIPVLSIPRAPALRARDRFVITDFGFLKPSARFHLQ